MKTLRGSHIALLFACLALAQAGSALAAAGLVEFASGEASIERGTASVPAEQGVRVESGDALVTGGDGRMRVVMSNGEQMTLHPNTRLVIDDYARPVSAAEPETGRSFYQFIRGRMDAVVQSLGRRSESSYQIRTSVATMGIRGTAWTMAWTPEGLYIQVTEGTVTLSNAAGTITVTAGQVGFVAIGGAAPVIVSSMPAAAVGIGAGFLGVGWELPVGILGVLGGLAIAAGGGGGGDDSPGTTPTTTTTTTTP